MSSGSTPLTPSSSHHNHYDQDYNIIFTIIIIIFSQVEWKPLSILPLHTDSIFKSGGLHASPQYHHLHPYHHHYHHLHPYHHHPHHHHHHQDDFFSAWRAGGRVQFGEALKTRTTHTCWKPLYCSGANRYFIFHIIHHCHHHDLPTSSSIPSSPSSPFPLLDCPLNVSKQVRLSWLDLASFQLPNSAS